MKGFWKLLPAMLGAGLMFAAPAHARNYDCSKAGNANKAVCKGAATTAPAKPAPAAPGPAAAPKSAAVRHYDCTKAGNANKAVCKGAAAPAAAPAPSRTSAAPKPATPASRPSAAPKATNAAGPNGATALCNDGSYSHSATHSGSCSHHGGVKTWY